MFDFVDRTIKNIENRFKERHGIEAKYTYVKCPACGLIVPLMQTAICSNCRVPLVLDQPASIILQRIHDPQYVPSKKRHHEFNVFINNRYCGQIKHFQTLTFLLPYGSYQFRVESGIDRKCNQPVITLSQRNSLACLQLYEKRGLLMTSFVLKSVPPSGMQS